MPDPVPSLIPRRKVVDPIAVTPLPDTLDAVIDQEATAAGVRPDLLRRMVRQESGGDPQAVSRKGAQGLGQLMPATAKALGVDPTDPVQNVRGSARYLKQQLDTFGGDETKALAAYNAGPTAVRKYGGVPPFKETQDYVRRILAPPQRRKVVDPAAVQPMPAVETPADANQPFSRSPSAALAGVATHLTPGSPERWLAETASSAIGGPERFLQRHLGTGEAVRATSRTVLPMAGSIAGGILGARSGPGSAVGGATLGGTAGEVASMGVEALTGAPPTLEEANQRYYQAAETAASAELAGTAITGVAGKLLRPLASKVTAAGREAILKYGHAFTPAQVTSSRGLNVAENMAKGALVGGGKYQKFLAEQQGMFDQERVRLVEQFGGFRDPERVGQVYKAARDAGLDTFKQTATTKYADVASKAGDTKIPMDSLVEFAEQELGRRGAIPGEVSGTTGKALLRQVVAAKSVKEGAGSQAPVGGSGGRPLSEYRDSPIGQTLIAALKKAGIATDDEVLLKDLSFEQARFFRSELQRVIREKSGQPGGQADPLVGITKQLLTRLDTAIDTALPAEAQAAYRAANAFYKEGKAQFDSKFLRTLAAKHPEYVADLIAKPHAVTDIRNAREAVTPAAWRTVQAQIVQQVLTNKHGMTATGGEPTEKLLKLSVPTLREIFPDNDARELQQFARILDQVQQNKEGTGKMWVQLTQASAVSKVATGGNAGAVARGTIVVPWLISTLFTSKLGRQWLTTGFAESPKSARFTRSAIQAGAWLAREAARAKGEALPDESEPPPAGPQMVQTPTPPPSLR